MRTKNSVINLIYIWGSTLVLTVLSLLTRRLFLDSLSIDYLGFDGLFNSIFSFLTLSEMGISGIITYHMYSEIASNNKEQISRLLYMYKTIYLIVGLFVLAAGSAASLFLPLLLRDNSENWLFLYTIYFLQLTATVCTYFLAYRRILFVTHQKIYVCTLIDTITTFLSTFAKIFILIAFKNYILYLMISIISNICSNTVIAWYSYACFPGIVKVGITKDDFKRLNLWYDVKNMMATKIAGTIYGSSDSIITTYFLGVGAVGLMNNYQMISSRIQEFILSIFKALQASIGNMVYDKESDKGISFFHALDLLGFYMGLVSAVCMIVVGQDFILFWLKKDSFQLPLAFLCLLALNVFISICNNPMNYFRNTLGHFECDRNYMIAAAILNVLLTLLFVFPMGVAGVMLGTVIGHLFIYMGRTVVVYRFYIKQTPSVYYLRFILRILLLIASAGLSMLAVHFIKGGMIGMIIKAFISVLISTLIFVLYSVRRPEFTLLFAYCKKVYNIILKKSKG